MVSAVRLWMRARSPTLRKWESEHDEPALYGSARKGAAVAAWASAFEAEDAFSRGGFYSQALLDLVKAFESVPHEALWHAAIKREYPLAILRLALAAYAMPRSVGRATSRVSVPGQVPVSVPGPGPVLGPALWPYSL